MIIPQTKPIILVTGANGQLGQEFRAIAANQEDYEFLFTTRETLDITDEDEVKTIISKWQPNYTINCAAYTAVDKAEEEVEQAFLINQKGPALLSDYCAKHNSKLIHISTDYVYDSVDDRPIRESDLQTPRSVYGKSKQAGEAAIHLSDADWMIIRVSWLYSTYANNFVKTMLRLGATRDELSIVSDQIGAPTYARHLAQAIITIVDQDIVSTLEWCKEYNYCNTGQTDWAAFARVIFAKANLPCEVSNTTTMAYGAPAPRPLWSVMDTTAIQQDLKLRISAWEVALQECLDHLPVVS